MQHSLRSGLQQQGQPLDIFVILQLEPRQGASSALGTLVDMNHPEKHTNRHFHRQNGLHVVERIRKRAVLPAPSCPGRPVPRSAGHEPAPICLRAQGHCTTRHAAHERPPRHAHGQYVGYSVDVEAEGPAGTTSPALVKNSNWVCSSYGCGQCPCRKVFPNREGRACVRASKQDRPRWQGLGNQLVLVAENLAHLMARYSLTNVEMASYYLLPYARPPIACGKQNVLTIERVRLLGSCSAAALAIVDEMYVPIEHSRHISGGAVTIAAFKSISCRETSLCLAIV
jgi:hypothetical protein